MFLSTTTNGIDAKGRLSVPADFRAVVKGGDFEGVYVWPSFDGPYLEGAGPARMARMLAAIDDMDPYDDARTAMARSIFGATRQLAFDVNGRITLPKALADHAGLDSQATFVGVGATFEIWEPAAYAAQAEAARIFAKENKRLLKLRPATEAPR